MCIRVKTKPTSTCFRWNCHGCMEVPANLLFLALKYALSLMTAIKIVIDFRCAKYMFGLIFIYCTCALCVCTVYREMRMWKMNLRRNSEDEEDMLTLRTLVSLLLALETSFRHSFDYRYRISHVIIGLRLNRIDNLYSSAFFFSCCYFNYFFSQPTYTSILL